MREYDRGVTSRISVTLLASALLLVGCGADSPTPTVTASPPPRPDYEWRLRAGDWGDMRLLVYDEAEMLVGMRTEPLVPGRDENIWWEPMPGDLNSLGLGWLGGVCADPTLRISREGQAVFLTLYEGVIRDDCPAVGIAYQVVLTLPYPVSEFDISVELSRSPPGD